MRDFNSLYRRGDWGTERLWLSKVGRHWSHLTLEPSYRERAQEQEMWRSQFQQLAAADSSYNGGITYPTALNKGHHKFHLSVFPVPWGYLIKVLNEHPWETMGYLWIAWKGRQKAHANIHQTNRYLMNISTVQSTLLGREMLKERENKQMQRLIRHSTCPRWLAK